MPTNLLSRGTAVRVIAHHHAWMDMTGTVISNQGLSRIEGKTVRRIPAYELRLDDGTRLWVEPDQVEAIDAS